MLLRSSLKKAISQSYPSAQERSMLYGLLDTHVGLSA
jgi:hypothetical protein